MAVGEVAVGEVAVGEVAVGENLDLSLNPFPVCAVVQCIYAVVEADAPSTACAAANRAIGTRYGEQLT